MGKNIAFKNLLIAASGDFGSNRTHNDLRRWVETNGGNFTTRLSEEVTHLVCTNDHWNRQVDTGKWQSHSMSTYCRLFHTCTCACGD
jgi:hypothetical protein